MTSGRGGKRDSLPTTGAPFVHRICASRWNAESYEAPPSPTDMSELKPPKLGLPRVLVVRLIVAEYAEEYIVVERTRTRV